MSRPSLYDAAEKHEGEKFTELFTEGGVYHDVFYGAFQGHERLREFNSLVFGTGKDYRWNMFDPVSDGKTVYARYIYSAIARRCPRPKVHRVRCFRPASSAWPDRDQGLRQIPAG